MKSPTCGNNPYEQLNKDNYDQKLHQINDGIFNLERNIADLNRNYKNMLMKLNVCS
jgi:hypothetical protein